MFITTIKKAQPFNFIHIVDAAEREESFSSQHFVISLEEGASLDSDVADETVLDSAASFSRTCFAASHLSISRFKSIFMRVHTSMWASWLALLSSAVDFLDSM